MTPPTDTVVSPNGSTPDGPSPSVPLFELLEGFVQDLRNAGLPVSLSENIDAASAVRHIPIEDRNAFKYALAATLVKNNSHWRTFETLFEVYFSLRGKEYAVGDESTDPFAEMDFDADGDQPPGEGGQGGGDGLTPEELAEMLFQALLRGDDTLMRAIARQAVKRYAGMEPGRPVGGTYYLYRTLRNLDLDGMMERLLEQSASRRGANSPRSRNGSKKTSSMTASTSSRRKSKPRSDAGSWPTVVPRPWPRPCASPCPKTSTSCTPAATRWRRCARRSTP